MGLSEMPGEFVYVYALSVSVCYVYLCKCIWLFIINDGTVFRQSKLFAVDEFTTVKVIYWKLLINEMVPFGKLKIEILPCFRNFKIMLSIWVLGGPIDSDRIERMLVEVYINLGEIKLYRKRMYKMKLNWISWYIMYSILWKGWMIGV